MLYLASEAPLPIRSAPEISVEPIEPGSAAVRSWFSLPEIRYIGAHTGCSCGFPSVIAEEPVEYYDGFFDEGDDRAIDLASVQALFALIDEALTTSRSVELFLVWAGDEGDVPPLGVVEVARQELDPERFFFTEHFLYRIAAQPV